MAKGKVNCILIGDSFNPKVIESETGLEFMKKQEKNEIGTFGKFKGKKIPYSSAQINIPNNKLGLSEQLEVILNQIEKVRKFDRFNTIDIMITIGIYIDENQNNFEFIEEQLERVVDLKIKLSISCY